ncbi:MAG: CBS domain-containing protein [Natronomonas sp.]|jgi:CBS domain-containing protein|uniref:CBS domain-containing protein n=1 Tax=Natronomonas sp. TaxID=2184060 RepID=UPI00286FB03A|nr:CBS domain-containing protein [Natronomonas sp.]MDR9381584.1 CBS domain-containing protein [Natronomonas sp.]MDR9429630.1 CBS domain-containing protein [Natronomonas sp.]
MNIADIATEEFIQVDTDERLGKVRSIFERENPKGIVVTEGGAYAGILTERQLIQSHIADDAKVNVLARNNVPRVEREANIRDVARMLVEGGTKVAPVFEDGDLWGIVTEDEILDAVLDNLDVLTVEQIYTDSVVTLEEDDRLGKVINYLRENDISRLPVVNENGRLSGMVTTHDIAEFAVRTMERQHKGDRSGDTDRMLDLPVYDLMNSPVETVGREETVSAAVERMFDHNYAGLVVTPDDDETTVAGILTKTDVLRALTYTEEENMDVQITNIDLLETISREDIQEAITDVADKYQAMQVHHAHVRLTEHKERLRGTPLVYCQIRLRTNHGQVAGSGEGYGAETAFHVALDKLERNVLELKGIRADEQYEGQLLRKLNEL